MNNLSPGPQARLMAIPRLAAGGRWRVEAMRSLSEPMLLWFTKGQGRITVAGVTRGYTAHNAVFIPAGVMHGFEVGPQVFGTAVFFGPNSDVALPVTPLHLRIRDSQSQVELNLCLDSIQREQDSLEPGHDRALRCHLGLLGVWLERQAARMPPDTVAPVSARRLVMGFTALLERDFRSGRGVADYAAAMGVTATHLTRCCQRTCGRPASALLQDRLLFEARRMLSETNRPVSHIARDLGFTSASYFTRAFLHQTGKTPSAFRRAP
ncbi:MAG: helix-turn-helix domain-containing protein [Rhodobacter sp.]|nr:helix-turn-helix domain-containing protein [Rhodobacter sp.]MCA3515164.1 helix-turn-helix domain-containing protein [Rhodobacter sp.]MCA3520091.1 helix-turn-helix domain-containing protein [Rhodobacter sp.]MCA3522022.1 helix-turn-helix domain-containing protein [Rhodobacter sp.]MCA3525479.1 helix-turn-helix domain-containing protein [Rhodobacter sp.]